MYSEDMTNDFLEAKKGNIANQTFVSIIVVIRETRFRITFDQGFNDVVRILEDSVNQSVAFGFYFVQCKRKINRFPDIV